MVVDMLAALQATLDSTAGSVGRATRDEDRVAMERLGPPELAKVLENVVFNTGDEILDEILQDAREKFTSSTFKTRKEAVEKIWDAFERLKTIEVGIDKKASVAALLHQAITEPDLRARINREMAELTEIGNTYMIRHTEVGKKPITESKGRLFLSPNVRPSALSPPPYGTVRVNR